MSEPISSLSPDSRSAPIAGGGPDGKPGDSRRPRFQTTRWSLIADAAGNSGATGRLALEDLCRAYWPPVYAFVRRTGLSAEEAEDLTQDFFADLVGQGPLIGLADPTRGRFRTFLLAAVKNRIANHRRASAAAKRGGQVTTFSIDAELAEKRYAAEPRDGWTPEALFHRRWALTLLENVLNQLETHYVDAGRQAWFEALRPFLTTDERPPYDELADQLQTTSSSVRVAVHRLRKHYRDALTEQIQATLGKDDTVSDEQNELLRAITGET